MINSDFFQNSDFTLCSSVFFCHRIKVIVILYLQKKFWEFQANILSQNSEKKVRSVYINSQVPLIFVILWWKQDSMHVLLSSPVLCCVLLNVWCHLAQLCPLNWTSVHAGWVIPNLCPGLCTCTLWHEVKLDCSESALHTCPLTSDALEQ